MDSDKFIALTFTSFFIVSVVALGVVIAFGIPVQTTSGEYQGYITSVEQNGIFFKGWNAYMKTDLTSSNEDKACVDSSNTELISDLKDAVRSKKNLTLEYVSNIAYAIGECPGEASFMIVGIRE